MSTTQNKIDSAIEAVKATPAVTTSGLILFGYPLSDWVLIGSAILITLQIIFLIRDKLWKPWKERLDEQTRNLRL